MVNHIKAGQRAEISFKNDDGKKRTLAAEVEAVLNNKEVLVLIPVTGKSMAELPAKGGYEAKFYVNGNILAFDVSVTEHLQTDGMYLTKLRMDSAGERIKMRKSYRIGCSVKFNFTLGKTDGKDKDSAVSHEGIIKDLSGGGMSFVTDLKLEKDAPIFADFIFDDEHITVLCRATGGSKESEGKYLCRCRFVGLSDIELEKISKFINNEPYRTAEPLLKK